MQISPTTAGALRLLVSTATWLRENPGGDAAPLDEIARAAGLAGKEATRVRDALERAGYIERADGRGRSLRLLAHPAEVALGAVVAALERPAPIPVPAVPSGPEGGSSEGQHVHLERTLAWAMHEVERFLGQYSLEQMIPGPRALEPCEPPPNGLASRSHLRLVRS